MLPLPPRDSQVHSRRPVHSFTCFSYMCVTTPPLNWPSSPAISWATVCLGRRCSVWFVSESAWTRFWLSANSKFSCDTIASTPTPFDVITHFSELPPVSNHTGRWLDPARCLRHKNSVQSIDNRSIDRTRSDPQSPSCSYTQCEVNSASDSTDLAVTHRVFLDLLDQFFVTTSIELTFIQFDQVIV